MRRLLCLALVAATAACVPAAPQAPTEAATCNLPARLPAPRLETVEPDEVVADRPIRFHLLALSWTPETCRAGGDGAGDLACDSDNRFGWTLHGLWPNSDGRPYPRYCRPAEAVPATVIRANLCRTPSVDLIQHEWAAHGTCGWETPESYFQRAATLHDGIRKPDPTGLTTAGGLRDAFARANPGLPREAVQVSVSDEGRLREARICLDLGFKPRACPRDARGALDGEPLSVEPIRP